MAWSALTNPLSSAVTYDQSISARRQTSQVITGAGADNWFRGPPWSISCQMIPACLCLRNHFWEVWLIRVLSLDLSNANSSSHPTQLMCTFKVGLHFNPKKTINHLALFRSARTSYRAFHPLRPVWRGRPLANNHLEGPAWCKSSSVVACLLQIIIRRHQPLANHHTEWPASCKSGGTGLLQMIILRDWPLANNHLDGLVSCKW